MISTFGRTREKTKNIINKCSVKKILLNSTVQYIIKRHIEEFSMFKMYLEKMNLVEHQITTTDEVHIACKTLRVPIELEDEVDTMVDKLIKTGVIKPSNFT